MNAATRFSLAATLFLPWFTTDASAHNGRRLEVVVVNDQLFVQGVISNGVSDFGGVVRPYYNVIHDHLNNRIDLFTGQPLGDAESDLPGFDVFSPNPGGGQGSYIVEDTRNSGVTYPGIASAPLLAGAQALTLTLNGVTKWEGIPEQAGMIAFEDIEDDIAFVPLEPGDPTISVHLFGDDSTVIGSDNLGTLTLAENLLASGATDLDLDYEIDATPTDTIYALEWTLSVRGHNGIADSDTIYTLLAPDPTPGPGLPGGPAVGRHFQTLAAERFLGTPATAIPVPEPLASVAMGIALALAGGLRRRGRKENA